MRLGPRDRIPIPAIDIELHNAGYDLLAAIRVTGNERIDRVAYTDTLAGINIYPFPEEAEEVRQVFFLGFGSTPIPMTRINFQEQPMVDWVGLAGSVMPFTYCELTERRIRLMNTPIDAGKDIILWKYLPKPKRLFKPDDEPNFPASIHECLIPYAVVRMAGYDGIGLSHPQSFEIYKRGMQERLYQFLQPEGIAGSDHVLDMDPYYPGGA